MSELKLVTRNIRINGIQHKASDMSEEEIKCLLIQRQDIILLNMNYERISACLSAAIFCTVPVESLPENLRMSDYRFFQSERPVEH